MFHYSHHSQPSPIHVSANMKIVTLYVRVTMLVCADAIAYALALCVALAGNGMGMALLFESEVDS